MNRKAVFCLLLPAMICLQPAHYFAQDNPVIDSSRIQWHSFNEAIALSKIHPRKIMVDLYTPWCGWCKEMDKKTFDNKKIAKYMNAHFYCVKFDAEGQDTVIIQGTKFFNIPPANGRNATHPLAVSILDGHMGYPSQVFLDETFNRIQAFQGYRKPSDFEAIIRYVTESVYKIKSFDQYFQDFKSEL
jgi:thioredoxin-related protein